MTDDLRGFVAVMTALWPPRGAGRRPPLADWLACHDINETWVAVRSGALRAEACPP